MSSFPSVSVIVPVHNAEQTIVRCVEALLAQEYPARRWDVLLVDNGSTDQTRRRLAAFLDRITVLEEPIRGASAARNAGAVQARSELLAFTDADCVPRPDWLAELVRRHRAEPACDLVGGRIEPYLPAGRVERFAGGLLDQAAAVAHPRTPFIITANLLARRSDLLRLGLFDEAFIRGQDVDLSLRAQALGLRLGLAERAVVSHISVDTLGALLGKGVQHGLAVYLVLRRHAERAGYTPLRWLLRPAYNALIAWRLLGALGVAYGTLLRDEALEERCANAFLHGVVDLGKQLGLLHALLTRPGRGGDLEAVRARAVAGLSEPSAREPRAGRGAGQG